jgi:cyclic beta-1,2-glucan synthetase
VRETIGRLREPVARLCHGCDEARYWFDALSTRIDIVLNDLYALAPWLAPPLDTELRIGSGGLFSVIEQLCQVPPLGALRTHYGTLADAIHRRLGDSPSLPEPTRAALELLLEELPAAEMNALRLLDDFERQAAIASRWVDEMDFTFLFDKRRKLLHIGYDAGADAVDPAYYDLLASEARSAVFLAIAKHDIPREAWFHLNRRLTSYRGRRALVSWSGTMFEYLMPALFMRTYSQTLIGQSAEAVIGIQRQFARECGVAWGISEAACRQRDHALNYQYRAFGIPALAANTKLAEGLVIAPYASMLGTMVDRPAAIENLRRMAAAGWLGRYGFYESVDYSDEGQPPEVIRAHMVHHQGMGLIALSNALLDGPMRERFHADPMVQATEYLLQERVPALVDITPELQVDRRPHPESSHGVARPHSHASAAP